MSNDEPLAAINEWSCALACVCWTFSGNKIAQSQEEVILKLGKYFPAWASKPGVMTPGDILNLLPHLGVKYGRFASVEGHSALDIGKTFFSDCIAAFILSRRPALHCMAIAGDWNEESVAVMDPNPLKPTIFTTAWSALFDNQEASILWIGPWTCRAFTRKDNTKNSNGSIPQLQP